MKQIRIISEDESRAVYEEAMKRTEYSLNFASESKRNIKKNERIWFPLQKSFIENTDISDCKWIVKSFSEMYRTNLFAANYGVVWFPRTILMSDRTFFVRELVQHLRNSYII